MWFHVGENSLKVEGVLPGITVADLKKPFSAQFPSTNDFSHPTTFDLALPGDVQWHEQIGGVLQNDWKLDAEFFKIFDDSTNKIEVTSSVKRYDLRTAEGVLNAIQDINRRKVLAMDIPSTLDPCDSFPILKSRDNSLIQVLKLFLARYQQIKSNTVKGSEVFRDFNFYFGSCGAPGCGKTRFLQELANLKTNPHLEQLFESIVSVTDQTEVEHEFLSLIHNWTPVLISFNDIASPNPEELENYLNFFSIRLLCS